MDTLKFLRGGSLFIAFREGGSQEGIFLLLNLLNPDLATQHFIFECEKRKMNLEDPGILGVFQISFKYNLLRRAL